ncbi:exopolyphosphatase [Paraferrimonas haliotis]|uniref:Exopolyphosphatase n=1 Tax=Paraferrimonas haliotis TaxID=2013866 RepID=A0AA37TMD5_9GAMM|nr:exopolyphosphatase [Paraferrimonas haliotis]GLS82283.1 exopolyphosphatase [Paraferrimonas haliotis]
MTDVAAANAVPRFAAITLGSNSFNMLVAQSSASEPEVIAKFKQKVRLAQSINPDGNLSPEGMQRGLNCLAWFAKKLESEAVERTAVKVYATAALRQIDNAREFQLKAQSILGLPLEIISGEQEAAIIFQGMTATTPGSGRRLVIDIGGASTEFIVGQEQQMECLLSLDIGCVAANRQLSSDAVVNENSWLLLQQWIADQVGDQLGPINGAAFDHVVGASGIVQSLMEIARNRKLPERIDTQLLQQVKQECLGQPLLKPAITGLQEERKPTLVSGIAILSYLFDALAIDSMTRSGGALREGVLYQAQQLLHATSTNKKP